MGRGEEERAPWNDYSPELVDTANFDGRRHVLEDFAEDHTVERRLLEGQSVGASCQQVQTVLAGAPAQRGHVEIDADPCTAPGDECRKAGPIMAANVEHTVKARWQMFVYPAGSLVERGGAATGLGFRAQRVTRAGPMNQLAHKY